MDSLSLVLIALALPQRHQPRSEEAKHASVIGMVGTAAEQAIAAILIQVHGDEAAFVAGSQYKTASALLGEVKDLLRRPPSRAAFLTAGVPDADAHRQVLLDMVQCFGTLMAFRAAGLHGGRGVGIDVAVEVVKRVYEFLLALGRSTRIKPYLETLPALTLPAKQTEILLEQLIIQLDAAGTVNEQAQALRSIFLVLPDTPPEQPRWLEALDRVAVVPTTGDVALLMAVVHEAIPGRLMRAAGAGPAMPVAIRPNAPGAVPVAPAHLRREFNTIGDQFAADSALANGRLNEGRVDLPPADVLLELFQITQQQLSAEIGHPQLTGQMAWPLIAAALNHPKATPRPYWFLVRLVASEQLQHLEGFLRRAAEIVGRPWFTERLREALDGIAAIRLDSPPPQQWAREVTESVSRAEQARASLIGKASRSIGTQYELPELQSAVVEAFAQGVVGASDVWQVFIQQPEAIPEPRRERVLGYWYRLFAEASPEPNDRIFLAQLITSRSSANAGTAARKALRLIDAQMYGPTLLVE